MDYDYEQLGDERFQELCQALLLKEERGLQCFPVGMPDGGRDATSFLDSTTKDTPKFAVYQVKYVREPARIDAPHKWLAEVVEKEAAKVAALIPKGATRYYLITNVRGTSHLATGSIDKVQRTLLDVVKIPSMCLWRDDLNRRLDGLWDLKWSFPELLSGQDVLRYALEASFAEAHASRLSTLQVSLASQYERDQEVRFKQVDFQNQLLDIFVESPLSASRPRDARRLALTVQPTPKEHGPARNDDEPGAANALMSDAFQRAFPCCVIEGAPGQGKSTLVQYICQLHRARLLGRDVELRAVSDGHVPRGTRLPFKVDLRDYASWLSGRDPFSVEGDGVRPQGWAKSLETFLVAQLRHYAGNAEFSVNDLHALSKHSALLIVLDGLDEVAGIPARREVVRETMTALVRLQALAASVQVIVTTRPAAFANSPGFPPKSFDYFTLLALNQEQISAFATKWIKSRRLAGREASDVHRVLKQKMEQPHLRELAKNPMQLTILLSLIHSKGASLPDKRTNLYDTYVDLFFARESEKSELVREYRELLIDMHRYLAWRLHSDAEGDNSASSVDFESLKTILAEYLRAEGRDTSIIDELFSTMAERVMFIVSRVEGKYEFEVQPIREYFAARHLHETAPYSPPGAERKGTRPDRFDALARNFYWLNVTRFFSGCFSKGELPSLAERLQDLAQSEGYRQSGFAAALAALLLGDWVFTQNPRSTTAIIELALSLGGLRVQSRDGRSRRRMMSDVITLSDACGRLEVVRKCTQRLWATHNSDDALEHVQILHANTTESERIAIACNAPDEVDRSRWLYKAGTLGVLAKLDDGQLEKRKGARAWDGKEVLLLTRFGCAARVERDAESTGAFVNRVLDTNPTTWPRHFQGSILAAFANIVHPLNYLYALIPDSTSGTFREKLRRFRATHEPEHQLAKDGDPTYDTLERLRRFVELGNRLWDQPVDLWRSSVELWNELVEHVRASFGDRWATYQLACTAGGVLLRSEAARQQGKEEGTLCERALYISRAARSVGLWKRWLEAEDDNSMLLLRLLILVGWVPVATIMRLLEELSHCVERLSDENWKKLAQSARVMHLYQGQGRIGDTQVSNLSPRVACLLSLKLSADGRRRLLEGPLHAYRGQDDEVLRAYEGLTVEAALRNPDYWPVAAEALRKAQPPGFTSEVETSYVDYYDISATSIPIAVATTVANNAQDYPRSFVVLCRERCRLDVASRALAVGRVASEEGWFSTHD